MTTSQRNVHVAGNPARDPGWVCDATAWTVVIFGWELPPATNSPAPTPTVQTAAAAPITTGSSRSQQLLAQPR